MLRRLALGLILLVTSLSAHALGLGDIHVRSGLNQPLEAEIDLLSVRPEDVDNISVSLASSEAFAQAGVERPFLLTSLYFRVLQKPDGKHYIRVFSQEPIKEPFLNYLVEVNWPSGRLIRQYTVLLDPPTFLRAAPPAIKAPTVATKPVQTETPPESAPPVSEQPAFAAETQISSTPRTASATGAYTGAEYGPVQRTDTLWGLANRLRPDGSVTIQQMMLALLKVNPDAFRNNNINGLKAGYTLRIPDLSEIAALSHTEALREVKQQSARWNDTQSARATATGTAAQDTADSEAGSTAIPDHRLKIVAASAAPGSSRTDGVPGTEDPDLKQELAITAEALESLKLENEELRSRISDLEKQVEMMQRMITLRDEDLSALQSKLAAAAAPDAKETTGAEPATADSPASEEQTVAESAPEQAAAESGAATEDAAATSALGGLLDNLPRDPKTLGMVGGALLLVLALIRVIRRRRDASSVIADDAQERALAKSPAGVAGRGKPRVTAAFHTGPDSAPADSDAQLETAPPPAASPKEAAASASADPIAEADVYIAYEQYPQAENILKRAIASQPANHELKLKLLEVYHLTRNSSAFLAQAEELYTALGGTGSAIWEKVAAMGGDLAPGSPLFGGGETFSTGDAQERALAKGPAGIAEGRIPGATNALDFTLDFDTGAQSMAASDVQDGAEYNLSDLQLDRPAKPDKTGEPEADLAGLDPQSRFAQTSTGLGPDFDLGGPGAAADASPVQDDRALEFDTDITTTDEVGTKLDLARAYIDMGDAQGARSLLDEVVQEGNAAQKKEAQELMRQIA